MQDNIDNIHWQQASQAYRRSCLYIFFQTAMPKKGGNIKRKGTSPQKRHYSKEQKQMAIDAIKGGMAIKAASTMYNVPRSTLQDTIHQRVEEGAPAGRKCHLGHEDERSLVDYACNRASMGIGFNKSNFLKYASAMARKRGNSFPKELPSEQWWRDMKKRHPDLSLRQQDPTSSVRIRALHPVKVFKFFSALKGTLVENNLINKPHCIWNTDETGCQLEHVPGNVVARLVVLNKAPIYTREPHLKNTSIIRRPFHKTAHFSPRWCL